MLKYASDIEGDSLSIASVSDASHGSVSIVTSLINGFPTQNNQKIKYIPNENFNGTDSFTYTISDGNGGSITKTMTVQVNPINDTPITVLNTATVNEDSTVTLDVLKDATDADGDSLSIKSVTQGSKGSVQIVNNKVKYIPKANYYGNDSFEYTITDGNGANVTQTVSVSVKAINDIPTATLVNITTNEDASKIIDVLKYASDIEGDSLSIASVSDASHGSVSIVTSFISGFPPKLTKKIKYIPNENFSGTDSFTYTISDGNGGTITKTMTVQVNPINDTPITVLDTATVNEDSTVTLDVLKDATDADGDSLSIKSVTQGSKGSVQISNNQIIYTPNQNFNGFDIFTYTISDGNGGQITKSITVSVNPINDTPVAITSSATVSEDTAITTDVLKDATDIDGDSLTINTITHIQWRRSNQQQSNHLHTKSKLQRHRHIHIHHQ